jgi:hypothetical protein
MHNNMLDLIGHTHTPLKKLINQNGQMHQG